MAAPRAVGCLESQASTGTRLASQPSAAKRLPPEWRSDYAPSGACPPRGAVSTTEPRSRRGPPRRGCGEARRALGRRPLCSSSLRSKRAAAPPFDPLLGALRATSNQFASGLPRPHAWALSRTQVVTHTIIIANTDFLFFSGDIMFGLKLMYRFFINFNVATEMSDYTALFVKGQ